MRRLVEVLADAPHRFVVSKGPRADEFDLPPNMWGEARLPQTSIIPACDLVITHGGNNTTTEAFHFGKPMIVLPLFWDQYDNAQRVQELGFGLRLDTYAFDDRELRDAVDRLLADDGVRATMAEERRGHPDVGRDGRRRGSHRGVWAAEPEPGTADPAAGRNGRDAHRRNGAVVRRSMPAWLGV